MTFKKVLSAAAVFCLAAPCLDGAGLLGRQKTAVNPDYSKTVWDNVMSAQALSDMRKGAYFLSVKKYEDAVKAFALAAFKNPSDPNAYLALGAALYWTGQVDAAVAEYKKALSLDAQNADAYQLLGIAYGWKGDVITATEMFEKADSLAPARPDVKMNLSSAYAVQKRLDEAIDYARMATNLAPREALYHHQLGVLSEALGRDAHAENAFKRSLKLYPYYEDSMLALAAMYEKRAQNQDALANYKRAVRVKPGDFVARLRYANLLYISGQESNAREIALKAFAITSAEGKGLALNPAYSSVKNAGAQLSPQIENLKKSLSRLNPGTEVRIEAQVAFNPVNKELKNASEMSALERELTLASAALKAENAKSFTRTFLLNADTEDGRAAQIETIAAALQQALDSAPKDTEVNLNIKSEIIDASPVYSRGESDQSAAYNPRTVGNDMGLWVTGRSWVRFITDIIPDIEERIDDAVEAGREPAQFDYILLGLAWLTLGEGERALESFNSALSAAPGNEGALLGKGTALIVLGKESEAAAVYEAALKLNPKNKTAAKNLSFLKDK